MNTRNTHSLLACCFVSVALAVAYYAFGSGMLNEKAFRTKAEPRSICVLPDNATIAVGDASGQIYLFYSNKEKPPRSWKAHTGPIQSLAASADGRKLASEARERTAVVWDLASGQKAFECEDPSGRSELAEPDWVNSRIAFSSKGDRLAAFGYFWDLQTMKRKEQYGPRGAVAISDKWLVTGSRRGFQVLAIENLSKQFEVRDDSVCNFAISPNQKWLAVGRSTHDYGLRLYSIPEGEELAKFSELSAWVFSVDFSADSKLLAVAARHSGILIFDPKKATLVKKLDTDSVDIYGLDFSDDGRLLASVG